MGCCFSSDAAEQAKGAISSTRQQAGQQSEQLKEEAGAEASKLKESGLKLKDEAVAAVEDIKVEALEGEIEITCKRAWVSAIIGAGGSTLKKLQEESGAEIEVADDDADPATVKIKGEPGAIAKAKPLIEAILKEAENPDYEGVMGKQLREQAQEFARLADEAGKEKDKLFDSGDKAAGHAKLEEVKELQRKMHEANAAAAQAIFDNRNAGKGERYMDFHGLRKDEALKILETRLETVKDGELELIPGAGNHSSGAAVLKPAMEKFLNDKGIKFAEKNAGTLIATL